MTDMARVQSLYCSIFGYFLYKFIPYKFVQFCIKTNGQGASVGGGWKEARRLLEGVINETLLK